MKQLQFFFMRDSVKGLSEIDRAEIERAQAGDRVAMESIIHRHEGLIRYTAKRYHLALSRTPDEIWSGGLEGIWIAVKKYSLAVCDVAFSTYAVWHIRACIMRQDYISAGCRRQKFVSLSASVCSDKEFSDIIPDRHAEDETETEETEIFENTLCTMPFREKHVLSRRYHGDTLKDVAQGMKITRERVRQIQNTAIKTMREKINDRKLVK